MERIARSGWSQQPYDEAASSDLIDPRTIRTRTFSKAYGMAGARIGYALASAEIIATFQKLRLHFGVNRTAQIGALAALDDDAFMRGVVAPGLGADD